MFHREQWLTLTHSNGDLDQDRLDEGRARCTRQGGGVIRRRSNPERPDAQSQ
jgi:hypothetical protein